MMANKAHPQLSSYLLPLSTLHTQPQHTGLLQIHSKLAPFSGPLHMLFSLGMLCLLQKRLHLVILIIQATAPMFPTQERPALRPTS